MEMTGARTRFAEDGVSRPGHIGGVCSVFNIFFQYFIIEGIN